MKNALVQHIEAMNAKSAAWVAEDPANRCAGMLTTDAAHWTGYGVTTVAELEKYLLVCDVFEATRSAWGYKPSWSHLMAASVESLRKELDSLCDAMRSEREREERDERIHAERTAAALAHKSGFSVGELVAIAA